MSSESSFSLNPCLLCLSVPCYTVSVYWKQTHGGSVLLFICSFLLSPFKCNSSLHLEMTECWSWSQLRLTVIKLFSYIVFLTKGGRWFRGQDRNCRSFDKIKQFCTFFLRKIWLTWHCYEETHIFSRDTKTAPLNWTHQQERCLLTEGFRSSGWGRVLLPYLRKTVPSEIIAWHHSHMGMFRGCMMGDRQRTQTEAHSVSSNESFLIIKKKKKRERE